MTQKEKVFDYLLEHDYITAFDAVVNLRVTRLAARIAELIADGVPVVKTWEESTNEETGETTRYLRYSLEPIYAKSMKEMIKWMREEGKMSG